MGSELVSPASPLSYTEQFEEVFPYYLSIGMTYEQFWEGEPNLPKYYREAHLMKRKRENIQAWRIGRYVYDALCSVSPLLHAFARNGTTAYPYVDRPYPITQAEAKEREIEKMKESAENFRRLVSEKNARLREVNKNANNDRPITD